MAQIITSFLTNTPSILLLPILTFPILFFLRLNKLSSSPPSSPLLPPSPLSLPIIDHLHLLSLPLHRTLARLASLHHNSPILLLRLATHRILLISSASTADQCFTKHDLIFANRPTLPSTKRLFYNFITLVAASYSPHWRNLRRIATVELFSSTRLNSLSNILNEEVICMIKQFAGKAIEFQKLELREKLKDMALSVVMRMMVGRRCEGEERERFEWVVKEGFELVKESSLGDFLPFLRRVGSGGRERRMVRLEEEGNEIFGKVVEEIRGRRRGKKREERTIVDRLLDLQEKDGEHFTDEIIKEIILALSIT